MLPIVNNTVRPWWVQFGAIVTDQISVRHMIRMAEDDVAVLRPLLDQYARVGLHDVVADCKKDIAAAEELIAAMKARLEEISK